MRRWLQGSVAERGLVLLVLGLCAFLVSSAAGTSLWLRSSADDIAAQVFGDAPVQATQLQVSYDGVRADEVPPSGGGEIDAALPDLLRKHLTKPRSLAVSPEMVPKALPPRSGEPAFLMVAGLPGSDGLVDLVEGRMPEPGPSGSVPEGVVGSWQDAPRRPVVVEVVLQEKASRELDLPVGTWVRLGSSSYQGVVRPPPLLHVVGTFRAADPYPSPLDDLDSLREPSISTLPEFNLVRATALAADEETVLAARWVGPPSVRWTFDPKGTPSAADAERLVEEGRQVQLQDWPRTVAADGAGAATGIRQLGQTVVDQRRASDGLVTLTLTALAGGAVIVLLAASLALASRRVPVTIVVRARGASGTWLVLRRGAEALVLVAPGLAGAVVAVWLIGRTPPAPGDVAAALAAAAVCVLVVTAAQTVPRGGPGGSPIQAALVDALQLVTVILAVTASALVLLGGTFAADDPLVLVLPPLLGAAAAVVVVRGLQVLLGGLRRAARRTRPSAPVVALSQASAVARRVVVASTALVLAVSSVVLAAAASDTLRRGAERAGWEQVGADVGVEARGLRPPAVKQITDIDGVRRVAPVFTADSVSVETRTGVEGVTVVGVDPATFAEVSEGRLRDLDLSPREDGMIPAVASTDLELDDERAQVLYAQSRVDLRVVDRLEQVPGVTEGGSFVLVDLTAFESATERTLQTFTHVLVSGTADGDHVRSVVQEVDPLAVVTTRAGVTSERLEAPAVARTMDILAAATVAATTLAVFGILLTVGLGAPERRRTTAVLAAVGGERRLAARIGMVALLPIVVVDGLAAAGCGLLLTVVAGRGLDLAGLMGTREHLAVRPDPATAAVVGAGLLALVVLAAAAARITRPARSADRPDPEVR